MLAYPEQTSETETGLQFAHIHVRLNHPDRVIGRRGLVFVDRTHLQEMVQRVGCVLDHNDRTDSVGHQDEARSSDILRATHNPVV